MRKDCIIVGSGISGLMTGCRLLESGMSVAIFEKGEPAREASWAGGGILSPLQPWDYPDPVVQLALWSQQQYGKICDELLSSTGIDPEYRQDGMLVLQPEVSPADTWAVSHGMRESLSAAEYASLIPGIASPSPKGFWFDAVAQARNPRLLQSLLARFEQLGGALHSGEAVIEIVVRDDRAIGVRTAAGLSTAGEVVVCAGAWSSRVLGFHAPELGIKPIRGQIVLLRGKPGIFAPVIVRGSTYLIPRKDGRVLIGSTTEDVGFDKTTDGETLDGLRQAAADIMPALEALPVEKHWAGLRPSPPSGVPTIGPVAGVRGLWVNAGHYRNGLVMAPGAAALLVAQMTDAAPPVSPEPYQIRTAAAAVSLI